MRINLLGAGRWGPNIIRCFLDMPDVALGRIVDTAPARLELLKQRYGADVSDNPEDALRDDSATAVVIATPVSTHYELARQALEQGLHVFVEKPMCASLPEGRKLEALAREVNRVLMVGHVFVFNPGIQKVKELIDAELLGEILYIDSVRTNLGPVREDVNAFWDLASHDISIIQYWLNREATHVAATGSKPLGGPVEDVVFATVHFGNNLIAHIHSSWLNPQKVRKITVVGSQRMAVWDDIDLARSVSLYDRRVDMNHDELVDDFGRFRAKYHIGDVTIPAIQYDQPLRVECEHFVDCIRNAVPCRASARAGVEVLKVLEAADRSLKESGRMTEVSE